MANQATYGRGIGIRNDTLSTVRDNTFCDSQASWGGGAIWLSSDSRLILKSPDDNSYEGNQPDSVFVSQE